MVSRRSSVCRPSICLSVCRTSVVFSFPDDNLSECQWIFTKLGMCIVSGNLVWDWIANGQISSFLTVICLRNV